MIVIRESVGNNFTAASSGVEGQNRLPRENSPIGRAKPPPKAKLQPTGSNKAQHNQLSKGEKLGEMKCYVSAGEKSKVYIIAT